MTGVGTAPCGDSRPSVPVKRTRPRIGVIGPGGLPLSPRGQRFHVLSAALAELADTDLVSVGKDHADDQHRPTILRRLIGKVEEAVLLDREELEAFSRLRRWHASVDAALLIGYPFSALSWAARRLARTAIPYVVDIGDPWVLTAAPRPSPVPGTLRALRRERFLWEHAAGAIVSTDSLAESLSYHFPDLPVLIRPNGFGAVHGSAGPDRRLFTLGDRRRLRVVHYGNLYQPRLDVAPFLDALAGTGRWEGIHFTTYGRDYERALARVSSDVETEIRRPLSWHEVVAGADEHDVALVVGNSDPRGLPSKAVQYLTLPIPRVALSSGADRDELGAYVADKPGWLTIRAPDDLDRAADLLAAHIERPWTAAELKPPPSEAWAAVTCQIVEFLSRCTGVALLGPAA